MATLGGTFVGNAARLSGQRILDRGGIEKCKNRLGSDAHSTLQTQIIYSRHGRYSFPLGEHLHRPSIGHGSRFRRTTGGFVKFLKLGHPRAPTRRHQPLARSPAPRLPASTACRLIAAFGEDRLTLSFCGCSKRHRFFPLLLTAWSVCGSCGFGEK